MLAAAWTGTIATTQYGVQPAGDLGQWLSAHGGVAILRMTYDREAMLSGATTTSARLTRPALPSSPDESRCSLPS
jgi:hypothetical protein